MELSRYRDVFSLLSVVIIISPFGMIIDRLGVYVYSFFWMITLRNNELLFSGSIPLDFFSLVLLLSRLLFLFLFVRLYKGIGSKKLAISIGVISEFGIVFIALLQGFLVYTYPDWSYVMIGLPLPILLCSAFILMHYWPLPLCDDTWLISLEKTES